MKKKELETLLHDAEEQVERLELKLLDSLLLGSKIAEAYGKEIGMDPAQIIMVIAGSGGSSALVG